ncbi:hypothetical protein M0811_04653 [Anaeramoeba ignava]|uniref:Uncharacterized protein n=1 Tax=Anaeramoeba ignava TaxID=1746090 RepID=A0A9Q0LW30_ANAIG|nr:hypothetical protein M0811_04653 [Anaeramoeba ignava]
MAEDFHHTLQQFRDRRHFIKNLRTNTIKSWIEKGGNFDKALKNFSFKTAFASHLFNWISHSIFSSRNVTDFKERLMGCEQIWKSKEEKTHDFLNPTKYNHEIPKKNPYNLDLKDAASFLTQKLDDLTETYEHKLISTYSTTTLCEFANALIANVCPKARNMWRSYLLRVCISQIRWNEV